MTSEVRRLVNRQKQRATVYSSYWNGGVNVVVAPPGNTTQAIIAALQQALKTQTVLIDYNQLVDDEFLAIRWGDVLVTKTYVRQQHQPPKRLTQKEKESLALQEAREIWQDEERQRLALPARCPTCDLPLQSSEQIRCQQCGQQLAPEPVTTRPKQLALV